MTKAKQDTAGKTENFFSRHVMLVTLIACIVVFIGLCVWFEYEVYGNVGNSQKPVITASELIEINSDGTTLRELRKYSGYASKVRVEQDDGSVKTFYKYKLVFDDRYCVEAVAPTRNGQVVEMVITDSVIDRQIDGVDGDLSTFFAEYQ